LKGRSAARKLCLNAVARQNRVNWCKQHKNWTMNQWRQIVFTDECRVGFTSDGIIRVWRRPNERCHADCIKTISTNRQSIMFWGGITACGVLPLQVCPQRMNSQHYISILESAAIPAISNFNLTFMDDNAPIHRAAAVTEWKTSFDIDCMAWRPYSPDISPIENIWAHIKKRLQTLSPQPTTLTELSEKFQELWNTFPADTLNALYDSIPKRVEMCIRNKGHPINY
jgi:hypothetical protein